MQKNTFIIYFVVVLFNMTIFTSDIFIPANRLITFSTPQSWFISSAPPLITAIIRIIIDTNSFHESFVHVEKPIKKFAEDEIKKITPQTITAVKIDPTRKEYYRLAIHSNTTLLMSSASTQEITDVLDKPFYPNSRTKLQGLIQHEAGHLHHNDVFWRKIIDCSTPLVINVIFDQTYLRFFNGTCFNVFGSWKEPIFSWWITYARLVLIEWTRMAFYRYQEQRADNAIENKIEILDGLKQAHMDNLRDINTIPYWKRWFINFQESHPLLEKRIEKLDQRIAALQSNKENTLNLLDTSVFSKF